MTLEDLDRLTCILNNIYQSPPQTQELRTQAIQLELNIAQQLRHINIQMEQSANG